MQQQPANEVAAPGSGQGARILAIDDSPTVLIHLRRILGAHGYRVETLDLLVELAERLKKETPDLIILDLHMPTLPGVPLGRLIRKFQPHEIPIVIYSSQPRPERLDAAAKVGAVATVQKGGPDDDLLAAVAGVLPHHRSDL